MMKKHIVCFGDSNTYGYCAETGGRYDETERWTCLLQRLLGEEYLVIEEGLGGRTISVQDPVNEGVCGLDYIYPCLMSHGPVDLLVIMLGTNDTKARFQLSALCISNTLKRLIRKARSAVDAWKDGVPNILIVNPKSIEKGYESSEAAEIMGPGCAEKSAEQGKYYERIAEAMGCHYFDANTVVGENNKIDYMHLTKEGHGQIANGLAGKIPECLQPPEHGLFEKRGENGNRMG